MRVQLVPRDGGPPLDLVRTVTVIGRAGAACDVCISDETVSELHCVVVKVDGHLFVRDLGTSAGTRINGRSVEESELFPRSVLSVGGVFFRVRYEDREEPDDPKNYDEEMTLLSRLWSDSALTPVESGQGDEQISENMALLDALFNHEGISATLPGEEFALQRGIERWSDDPSQRERAIESATPPTWYCQFGDEEAGPVSFVELVRWADDGRIDPSTKVKKGVYAQWVPAASVYGLFPITTPPVARQLPHTENRPVRISEVSNRDFGQVTDSPVATDGHTSEGAQLTASVFPAEHASSASAQTAKRAALPGIRAHRMRGALSLKALIELLKEHPKLIFAATVIVAVLTWFALRQSAMPDEQVYANFLSYWSEFKDLRARHASQSEWETFLETTRAHTEPIIHDLEKTASAKSPARLELLWAGRDYLMAMMSEGQQTPTPREEYFSKHMAHARRLLDGEDPSEVYRSEPKASGD